LLTAHGGAHNSYEKGFAGVSFPVDNTRAPELVPFADLQADRLRVHGKGHLDVTSLLPDGLVMAYREARSLLANLELGSHPSIRDSGAEVVKLAKLWDQNGLLRLHTSHRPKGSLVKVFNCYKNAGQDRQIGDHRGQNSNELQGPGAKQLTSWTSRLCQD